jgi:hypothetical protein
MRSSVKSWQLPSGGFVHSKSARLVQACCVSRIDCVLAHS